MATERRKDKAAGKIYSLIFCAVTVIVKFIAGAVTSSVFVVVSAFYSCGTGIAKVLCFKGERYAGSGQKYYLCLACAGVLFASALLYCAGAVRQLYAPSSFYYGKIPAIAIATVSFYDLGAAVAGIVKERKKGNCFVKALKRINFTGALAAIALTQAAILSFADGVSNKEANAIAGIIVGAAIILSAAITLADGLKNRRIALENTPFRKAGEDKDDDAENSGKFMDKTV